MLMLNFAILIGAVVVLAKVSEFVINRIIAVNRMLNINALAVGFIVLSVATTLPEITLAVQASTYKAFDVSLGDVLGSPIVNIGVALGLALILCLKRNEVIKLPEMYAAESKAFVRYGVLMLLISALFILLCSAGQYVPLLRNFGGANGITGALFGLALILLFIRYVFMSAREWGKGNGKSPSAELKGRKSGGKPVRVGKSQTRHFESWAELAKEIFIIIVCGFILFYSAKYILINALVIMNTVGITGGFIGGTLIAICTSLPEISVAYQAIRKRQVWLVVGDLLGSNIINFTLVLGILLSFTEISYYIGTFIVLVIYNLIMFGLLYYMLRKKTLSLNDGIVLAFTFLVYLAMMGVAQYMGG